VTGGSSKLGIKVPVEGNENMSEGTEQEIKYTGETVAPGLAQTNFKEQQANQVKTKQDTIAFLCPKGHKLNGPSKLAGKLGLCPHCGLKFMIPTLDEIRAFQGTSEPTEQIARETKPALPQQAPVTKSMPDDLSLAGDDDGGNLLDISAALLAERQRSNIQRASTSGLNAGLTPKESKELAGFMGTDTKRQMRGNMHPLAELMLKLWNEREHGGIIELHLEGGTIYLPDWFDKEHSQSTHGLFAAQAADGSVTMTVVPWETVQRVIIRGLEGLPDGMFE
jgi:hypothetical protein